ncbi:MAG: hypothetical protein DCC55_11450 [Chloroflexi bacterium]|nr:MAG: hypothetical protein DCC55_11450 [Chloroflexota bacterium]
MVGEIAARWAEIIAILAFAPGGIEVFGQKFEAGVRRADSGSRSTAICWTDNNELSVEDIV